MELAKQVCNLELSKRLKEFGIKQKSLWWWGDTHTYDGYHSGIEISNESIACNSTSFGHYEKICSAFTVAELGEMLPLDFNITKYETGWYCNLAIQSSWQKADKSEANARAKMLIWLIENKKLEI